MSVDINNLTGTESLEELEAALNALDESDNAEQEQQEPATQSEEKDVTIAPSAAEDKGSDTKADESQASEAGSDTEKVILSKDGKHQIPYEVLEAERAQKQQLAAENARLKAEVAEREKLQKVLEKHGIDPNADPDKLDVAEIEQLAQDYPELGKVLTGIATRLNAISQPQAAPAQQNTTHNDVQAALQAVPELKGWMENDQDRATFAISVDDRLKADPAWADKPLTERFAEVTRRTKAAFGDVIEPAKQAPKTAAKPDTKDVEVRDCIPASPTDLGQSVQHESKSDKYGTMTQEQLMAEMSGMTPAQIDALLAELDI